MILSREAASEQSSSLSRRQSVASQRLARSPCAPRDNGPPGRYEQAAVREEPNEQAILRRHQAGEIRGAESDNPFAYRHYDPTEVVLGKTMADHLRPAVCYWHNFAWPGTDMFGAPTFERPWFGETMGRRG